MCGIENAKLGIGLIGAFSTGELDGSRRHVNTDHPAEMLCEKPRLAAIPATDIDHGQAWVHVLPEAREVFLARTRRYVVPEHLTVRARCLDGSPESVPLRCIVADTRIRELVQDEMRIEPQIAYE